MSKQTVNIFIDDIRPGDLVVDWTSHDRLDVAREVLDYTPRIGDVGWADIHFAGVVTPAFGIWSESADAPGWIFATSVFIHGRRVFDAYQVKNFELAEVVKP